MTRPPLFLTALYFGPRQPSEAGKGFQWACALAPFFTLHIFTESKNLPAARASGLCDDWTLHGIPFEAAPRNLAHYWILYRAWGQRVVEAMRAACEQLAVAPVAVHHVTNGGFRVLPPYERLGIPYTLGPLGGGEFSPARILWQTTFPWKERLIESFRPLINRAMVRLPATRRTLRGSRMTLATTPETEAVIRSAGARRTAVVFPDIFEPEKGMEETPEETRARRTAQSGALRPIRLIWAARFRWWKGGQIAVDLVRELRQAGIEVRLDLYSGAEARPLLDRCIAAAGVEDAAFVHDLLPRRQLIAAFREAHLFVFPSLHDSSSVVIPEAYATGLPSLTLGLGGTRTATAAAAGLNRYPGDLRQWFREGVELIRGWQADPRLWLAASRAACDKSREFTLQTLQEEVRVKLLPALPFPGISP